MRSFGVIASEGEAAANTAAMTINTKNIIGPADAFTIIIISPFIVLFISLISF